jgi:hypothetical protein
LPFVWNVNRSVQNRSRQAVSVVQEEGRRGLSNEVVGFTERGL